MSVDTLSSRDPFRMSLRAPAEVDSGGTVIITGENLPLPESGAIDSDDISNVSSVAGVTVSAALNAVEAKADAALVSTSIYAPIFDILSASAETNGVDGYAGTITRISVVANNAIAAGDLVVTFSINGVAITDGVVTVPAATTALTRVATSPSALNVVAANDVISWVVGGGNTAAGNATIRIAIDTTTP